MLRGVWVLFELVKNILEENGASMSKDTTKGIQRHWEKLKRTRDHGIQEKRIFFRRRSDTY